GLSPLKPAYPNPLDIYFGGQRSLRHPPMFGEKRSVSPKRMPIRFKTPFLAVGLIVLLSFLWGLSKYDHAAITRTSGAPHWDVEKPIQPGKHQEQLPPGMKCTTPHAAPPVFNFKEWMIPKEYSRSYIRPRWVDPETPFNTLENINTTVIQDFKPIGRLQNSSAFTEEGCPRVVDVDVAKDLEVEGTEDMLFGIATTVERLDRMLPSLLYSFGHTKANILVLLPGDTQDVAKHEERFRTYGLNVNLRNSPLAYTARYFGLVEAFMDYIKTSGKNIKWLTFMDDDTFFPSLNHIARRLNQLDHNDRWYIGTLSEASWQVHNFGAIAFGGGGVFISRGLLNGLIFHYNECQAWGDQPGDQKVAQCIFKFTNTQLTKWDSLWQLDITGTVDGFFESGRTIDSLHHWSSWYKKDVATMHAVGAHSGRRGVLRRWKMNDEVNVDPTKNEARRSYWVLTNGYSIVKYSMDANLPADAVDFNKVEKTWNEDESGFQESLAPLRSKDQEGIQKERYLLAETYFVNGNIHQVYSRDLHDKKSIIELIWLPPTIAA
ncbi:hypothetical protein KEM55_008971, partial [Ascosphaera atra]